MVLSLIYFSLQLDKFISKLTSHLIIYGTNYLLTIILMIVALIFFFITIFKIDA